MQISVKVENLAVSVRVGPPAGSGPGEHSARPEQRPAGRAGVEAAELQPRATNEPASKVRVDEAERRASASSAEQEAGANSGLLLDGVCAYVKPGQIMAVMGASGCGKTTFLSTLSGRQSASAGTILFNGNQLNKALRRQICYVLQNDVFFANLTLRQTLEYTALLRLSDSMGREQKMRKVDEIIEALDLKCCEQTLVGDFSQAGLSGGQKKRLSIACELLSNPAIMLLDEPTSSLDSCTALNLMKLLKQYAQREQKTIIMSIHQPSSQIFYMFDKLLLLSRGQMLYFGSPQLALPFFNHFHYHLEHLSYNPADFLLEISKQMDDKELAKISLAARSTFFATHRTNSQHSTTSGCQSVKSTGSTLSCGSMPRLHSPASQLNQHQSFDHHHHQDNSSTGNKHQATQISHQFVDPPSRTVSILDQHNHQHYGQHHDHHHHNYNHQDEHSTTRLNLNFESPSIHGSMSKIYIHEDHFDCGSSTEGDYDHYNANNNSDSRNKNIQSSSEHRTSHEWPSSFMTQVCALTSRNFIESRARVLSKLNWIQTIGMALISGAMWFQLARNEDTLEDVKGWIYFSTTYWMMVSLFSTLSTIPQESQVISKERLGGYYRLSAYYVAKMIAELPLIVVQPSIYHLISYPMLGLYSIKTFLAMWLMVVLNSVAAQSIGLLIGYSFKRVDISLTVASLYSTSTMLFAGFYAKNIPIYLSWYRFFSLIYYGFINMQLVEFTTGPPIVCAIKNSRYPSCYNQIAQQAAGGELINHQDPTQTISTRIQPDVFSPNRLADGSSMLKQAVGYNNNFTRDQFVDPNEIVWGLDRFRPTEAPTPFWFNTLCLLALLIMFRFAGYLVLRSYHKTS